MQIHELNKKPQQINEVDLVGPNSIWNVGRQVIKNPKALWSSSQLGAAQQAAQQASAAKSAEKLAKQGYQVGASQRAPVTVQQQLAANQSNPGVQQQVKNLANRWMVQSSQLKQALKISKPVVEAAAQFDVRDLSNPKYASIFKAIRAQDTAKSQIPGQNTAPDTASDQAKKDLELERELSGWKDEFQKWSDPLLRTSTGIDMNTVRQNQETAKILDSAITNVAVAARSGNPKVEQQAVEEYLQTAISAIQTANLNSQQQQQTTRTQTTGAASAGEEDQAVLKALEKYGLTKANLEGMGKEMIAAAQGNSTIKNTGNSVLNAIARLAGMTVR